MTGSASPVTAELQNYLSELNMKSPHGKIQLAQANTTGKSDQTDDLLIEAEKALGAKSDKPKQEQGDTAKQDNKSEPDREVAEPDEKQPDTEKTAAKDDKDKKTLTAAEEHLQLFVENRYPAAATCGICHPKHYKEWSVSQHAYAQISPIYLSLNNKINELSNGSNGDFCLRCHSPVGANLGESTFESNLDRHPTSREGITCVVCHRINKAYNKVSGRLALVEGG
ncbi:MAG: multiheme c-type cytochrome, partial [Anderseniella sp.]